MVMPYAIHHYPGEEWIPFARDPFGKLASAFRIGRIGTMGYNAREDAVLATLAALEAALSRQNHIVSRGAAVDAALSVYG